MTTPRPASMPKPPAAATIKPFSKGSTSSIYKALMVNHYEPKVSKDVVNIPATNTVFKALVSLYIRQTMATKDSIAPSIQRLLEFSGSIAGRLPKSDTNKLLLARQEELFTNKFGAYTQELESLKTEMARVHTDIDQAITNILRILAPNPSAQDGSMTLRNQINNADGGLKRLRTQSEVVGNNAIELQSLAVTHLKNVSTMSGSPNTPAEIVAIQEGYARPSVQSSR